MSSFLRTYAKKPGQELLTFLHVQLAEAINLQDRSLSAQLHETLRSCKDLQPGRYKYTQINNKCTVVEHFCFRLTVQYQETLLVISPALRCVFVWFLLLC